MKNRNGSMSVKKHLTDKHGFTKIQWCILLVVLAIIMAFIISYVVAVNIAESQKKIATQALDAFVEENAIRIYSEVKQNSDYTEELLEEEYLSRLIETNGLIAQGTEKYASVSPDGKTTRYIITRPQMAFEEDYSAKVILSYTISVPLEFNGGPAIWVDIPMTITSRFMPKYEAETDQKDPVDKTPPVISVSVPSGTSQDSPHVTPYETITVMGIAQDEDLAYVSVNGDRISVSEGGAYQSIVVLNSGLNAIQIVATDRLGNVTTKYVYVSKEGAKPLDVTVEGYEGTYDGAAHSISVQSVQNAIITYSLTQDGSYTNANPVFTNAGTYRVYYRVEKDEYETKTGSAIVKIDKADNILSATQENGSTISMRYPETANFLITDNPSGSAISVTSSDPSVVAATINDNQISLEALNNSGTSTIVVTAAETTNYKTGTWTVIVNVSSCTHSDTFTDGYVQETCTTEGYTGDVYCRTCNDLIGKGSVVPALDHDYSAEVVAAEYLRKAQTCTEAATYYFKCTRCDSCGDSFWVYGDVAEHDMSAYGTLMSTATCLEGSKYYKKCKNCPFQSQDEWVINGEKVGHNYSVESGIQATSATCKEQATYYKTCCWCDAKDNSKTYSSGGLADHVYSAKGNTLVSSATCKAKATYYYECCWCGLDDTKTYSHGELANHSYSAKGSTLASSATCKAKATYYYECCWCGLDDAKTYSSGELAEHSYTVKGSTPATSASCTKKATYYFECSWCGLDSTNKTYESGNLLAHTPTGKVIKYDTTNHYQKCSGCGSEISTKHTQSTSLYYGSSSHWHPCTEVSNGCEMYWDKTSHTYSYSSVNGSYHSGKCKCGATTSNQAHDLVYEDVGDYSEHVGTCSQCGYSDSFQHELSSGSGTGYCTICGGYARI